MQTKPRARRNAKPAAADNSAALALLASGPDATVTTANADDAASAPAPLTDAQAADADKPDTDPRPDAADTFHATRAALRLAAAALIRDLAPGTVSCPLKPVIRGFKPRDLAPRGGSVSERPAAALAAAILASGQRIPTTDAAEPITVPRAFATDAGRLCIENGGGGQRILDMPGASYAHGAGEPDDIGTFRVTVATGRAIVALLGNRIPADARS